MFPSSMRIHQIPSHLGLRFQWCVAEWLNIICFLDIPKDSGKNGGYSTRNLRNVFVRLFHLKMVQKAFISFSIFDVGGNVSRFDCFKPSFWSFFSHLFAWIEHGRHHSNRGRSPWFQFRDEHRVRKATYRMVLRLAWLRCSCGTTV